MALHVIGGRNVRAVYVAHAFGTSNAANYSPIMSFGDASPRRLMVLGFECSHLTANLAIPHACTIGGVTATRDFTNPAATGGASQQFWSALVPTGTSGTVSISRAANMGYGNLHLWAVYDLPTPYTVVEATFAFASPASLSLDTLAGGVALGFAHDSGGGASYTWTGLTEEAGSELTGSGTASAITTSAAGKFKTLTEALAVSSNNGGSHALNAIAYR